MAKKKMPAAAALLNCLIFLAAFSTQATSVVPPAAVYVFGDCTVDVGNNNFLPGDAPPKANFRPYGVDFLGGVPTGRFSNGFIGVDYIAKAAGLPLSPPPFLSLADIGKTLVSGAGVNFASAGSGILDSTGKDEGVIAMTAQIKDFERVVAKLRAVTGEEIAALHLKRSLFFLSAGGNDLFALASRSSPGDDKQKDEFVALVIDNLREKLQALYQLGARKFAVSGTGFLGCIPRVRITIPSGDCSPDLNDLSLRFNTATKALLAELSESSEGFKSSFVDFYAMAAHILDNPLKHGFTERKAACCGSGRLNAEGPCAPNATYCHYRSQYLYWDSIRPTQAVHQLTAQLAVYGPPKFAAPVNIQQLLKTNHLGGVAATSPAVYVFGDSTVDVGNNNFLSGSAPKANFRPYGIDFPGGIPTGRFTNGFTALDYVAKAAGLPRSPPSYLFLAKSGKSFLSERGVNFASAGSGILDSTGKANGVISLAAQIKNFERVVSKLRAKKGKRFAADHLKESLFFLSDGGNDFFALATLISPGNATQKDEAVALVIGNLKRQLQALYKLGARKFAVSGTVLLGCIPRVRVEISSGDCSPNLNDLSLLYSTAAKALLAELSVSLKRFKYSFADSYEMAVQVLADPRKYGFTETKAACCGSGRLNAVGPCAPNATYCGNRNQYFYWDSVHRTQAAYQLTAQLSVYGPPQFAGPVNILQLLKSP